MFYVSIRICHYRRLAAGYRAACTGLQRRKTVQTFLGVTGSGKTFIMANVIQALNRPTLILAHNKTLASQLYGEFKEFSRRMPLNISYLSNDENFQTCYLVLFGVFIPDIVDYMDCVDIIKLHG